MFTKPYKVKSHNTLKNTERKQLIRLAVHRLPSSEENIKLLFPSGSPVTCARLSPGVAVYAAEGHPAILETEEALIPALPALWKVPKLLPTITVHDLVLPRLQNGAPLYLPGVAGTTNRESFPRFERGCLLAINTESNKAAGAVGRAVMSSGQMMLGTSGVAVEVLHIVGDHLCKDTKYTKTERPQQDPPATVPVGELAAHINQLSIHPQTVEEWPSLGSSRERRPVNQPQVIADTSDTPLHTENTDDVAEHNTTLEVPEESTEDNTPSNMDDLLRHCLLSFIKLQGKKVELPLKTNLLYRNHLMPYCPPGRTLDVKKSTYKKMSKFMDVMQKEGLVEVCELERGVDAVVSLAVDHPTVRGHVAVCPAPAAVSGPPPPGPALPTVRELLCVTAAVSPLFPGLRKGTALPPGEVRAALTSHVKTRSLAGPTGVSLDSTLASIMGKPEQSIVGWEELMSCVERRMTASTELRFPDGRVTSFKSKLEPVIMQVLTRSGNKKVTLVSNLEQFGFNLQELSRSCQAGVAASCGVTRAPGAKRDQLMLQGDQTYYIAKLLTETCGLPKKFVDGADKALKKKNK